MDRRNVRGGNDISYQTARFIHIACDLFDSDEAGGNSIGVDPAPKNKKELEESDPGDNGIFVVYRNGDSRIVKRFSGFPGK